LGRIILAVIFTALASQATAKADIHWCDSCTVEQEKALVPQLTDEMGTFDFYIGNLNTRTVHKYQLARGWSQPPCSGRPGDPNCNQEQSIGQPSLLHKQTSPQATILTYVYEKTVEPDIAEAYDHLTEFYYTAPTGWKKQFNLQIIDPTQPSSVGYRKFHQDGKRISVTVDTFYGTQELTPVVNYPDPQVNVYDIAKTGDAQNRFLDNIKTTLAQQMNINMTYLQKVLSALGFGDSSKMPGVGVVVYFSDGGQVTLNLDTSTTAPRYVINPGTARDSHNNTVPITLREISGVVSVYDFRGSGSAYDQPNMHNQLRGIGANVGPVPSGSLQWSCGANPDGSTGVTCNLY